MWLDCEGDRDDGKAGCGMVVDDGDRMEFRDRDGV